VTRIAAVLLALWFGVASALQPARPPAPIVVLISFDGWRWDYLERVRAPTLKALAARGVRATELLPSFPTLTFPNHYTIVTGLWPEHHGIVSNTMADPAMPDRFSMSAPTAKDPRWWGGEPIWTTAVRQGRRAATMFWPGTDAPIGGAHPTYWQPFDDKFPNTARVTQVLEWLGLPDDRRPSFVTLYFSDVDHAGHESGPDSRELLEAAAHLDDMLGLLVAGVQRLGLTERTTLVVVSDHGMTAVSDDRLIFLDDLVDPKTVDVIDSGSMLQIAPRTGTVDELYRRLRGRAPHLTVYRKEQMPARLHYRNNPRIAPIIGMADAGWTVTSRARRQRRAEDNLPPARGAHGYDPTVRDMHALFVAAGPSLRRGLVVKPFENVHIYELLCALLDVTPARNDGNAAVTRGFLTASSR
jgi:predicted AlkP superfamily pyrophosphatase or phosphodiesterase